MSKNPDIKYYHGGPQGFRIGSFILPPSMTKAKCTTDIVGKIRFNTHNKSKVYITTSYEDAVIYASVFKSGRIYEVNPAGELTKDNDYDGPDLSLVCESARIVRIHKLRGKEIKKAHKTIKGWA